MFEFFYLLCHSHEISSFLRYDFVKLRCELSLAPEPKLNDPVQYRQFEDPPPLAPTSLDQHQSGPYHRQSNGLCRYSIFNIDRHRLLECQNMLNQVLRSRWCPVLKLQVRVLAVKYRCQLDPSPVTRRDHKRP